MSGKTQELRQYGWGPMNMGQVIDTLYEKMVELSDKPRLILDEDFMIGIFADYHEKLPPFNKYWNYLFNTKRSSIVARQSGTKEVPLL
jgi:hypothetical protein